MNKYVTEEQIYDFYKSINEDKDLKLTWIANFTRIIPSDLVKLKKTLDNKELFDNYVILHYDPEGTAMDLTEEQKEIKRDPILFGVMQNSRKLYYVGDWKDEYCDLTLEDMFEELGEQVLEINNRTVKSFIDNGGTNNSRRKSIKKKLRK